MDKFQELKHRWRASLEENQPLNMTTDQIKADVSSLLKIINKLEGKLADAVNPVSSRVGSAVTLKDGVLYYRLIGTFVSVQSIVESLKLLDELRKSQIISKKLEKESDSILKEVRDIFKDPFGV